MKKTLSAILGIAMLFSVMSCGTTTVVGSGIKGRAPKVANTYKVLVDYQGASLGREIPAWVELLVDGNYDAKAFTSVMPGLKDKKIFVAQGRGSELSFVKEWINLVDIETEVSGIMERVVGKAIKANAEGTQETSKDNNDAQMNKDLELARISVQNVRLAGLERVAEYWTEIEVQNKKGEKIDSYYEYYSLWAMDQKVFDDQLAKSLERIDETTTEAERLKSLVTKSLENQLMVDADEDVKVVD